MFPLNKLINFFCRRQFCFFRNGLLQRKTDRFLDYFLRITSAGKSDDEHNFPFMNFIVGKMFLFVLRLSHPFSCYSFIFDPLIKCLQVLHNNFYFGDFYSVYGMDSVFKPFFHKSSQTTVCSYHLSFLKMSMKYESLYATMFVKSLSL